MVESNRGSMEIKEGEKMKTRILSITLAVALAIVFCAGSAYAEKDVTLIYYDGHMHTWRSDGSGTVADIVTTAKSRGLSAVIITDHCPQLTQEEWDSMVAETEAASDATFLALPGFEMTGSDGMFNRAHINAFGVDDPFVNDDECLCPEEVWESPVNPAGTGAMNPENLAKWVDYIHSKGGIAVHNHPSGSTALGYGVRHMEVYNQSHVDDVAGYAIQLGYPPEDAWGFGITLNNFTIYGERDVNMLVDFPGIPYQIPLRYALFYATEIFSGIGQWLGAPQAPLSSWDELLTAYVDGAIDTPIFGLANSDAHNTGDPESIVGSAKNGVYVKDLTAAEFLKALKAGRSFATTGPSLALDVNGELMGDTAYVFDGAASVNLSVDSENIIKNGELRERVGPFAPSYSLALEDTVTEDGYYRVEVTSMDVLTGGFAFAWSNPVFVRVP
jgi:hypothetical protein